MNGIALAVELAAARVRTLTVTELSERLDDRFDVLTGGSRTALPRHRTLRALVDWSHDLLTEPEKVLLRGVSVFTGGWTMDAAERVCGVGSIGRRDVPDLLSSLADKNLVLVDTQDDTTRFGMLETVRHYARDRLRDSGEAEAAHAEHVRYFLTGAEKLAEQQNDTDRQAKLSRLDKEHDNLRASLAWCETHSSCSQSGLRLAGKLYWFWRARATSLKGATGSTGCWQPRQTTNG